MPGFKELNLYPVSSTLRMPDYKVTDSIRYDAQTILNYTIKSVDSLLNMNCFIKSYENDPDAKLDIIATMMFQKQEVEFNRDTLKLLRETFENIDTVKIGYLKYLIETPTEKFYESRIFFYRGRKIVVLWLFEKYQTHIQDESSVIDCILQSIKLN